MTTRCLGTWSLPKVVGLGSQAALGTFCASKPWSDRSLNYRFGLPQRIVHPQAVPLTSTRVAGLRPAGLPKKRSAMGLAMGLHQLLRSAVHKHAHLATMNTEHTLVGGKAAS